MVIEFTQKMLRLAEHSISVNSTSEVTQQTEEVSQQPQTQNSSQAARGGGEEDDDLYNLLLGSDSDEDAQARIQTILRYFMLLDGNSGVRLINTNSTRLEEDSSSDSDSGDQLSSYSTETPSHLVGVRTSIIGYNRQQSAPAVVSNDPRLRKISTPARPGMGSVMTFCRGHKTAGCGEEGAGANGYLHPLGEGEDVDDTLIDSDIVQGDLFLSASQDDVIRLYDTTDNNFKKLTEIQAQAVGWAVLDTALSKDNAYVAYSSWCNSIFMVNISDPTAPPNSHVELPLYREGYNFCVFSLTFSHQNNEILCGANRGQIYIYSLERQLSLPPIHGHRGNDLGSVVFADDSSHILFSAGDDGICKVWDRRDLSESNPKPAGIFAGHKCGITKIDSKNDGRYLITNSKDQTIKLWDMRRFSPHDATPNLVRWDYRYRPIPDIFKKHEICEYDTSLMTYLGHKVMSTLIRSYFSPAHTTGQQYIYSGSSDGRAYIYEVLTGKLKVLPKGHDNVVRDVSWHPYQVGRLLTSSFDGVIREWNHDRARPPLASTYTIPGATSPQPRRQRHLAGDAHLGVSQELVGRERRYTAGSAPDS